MPRLVALPLTGDVLSSHVRCSFLVWRLGKGTPLRLRVKQKTRSAVSRVAKPLASYCQMLRPPASLGALLVRPLPLGRMQKGKESAQGLIEPQVAAALAAPFEGVGNAEVMGCGTHRNARRSPPV